MKLTLFILLSYLALSHCDTHYIMGEQGQSCNQACYNAGKNCNPRVVTDNTISAFEKLGIKCEASDLPWFGGDQPAYISDPSDFNYGRCLGYIDTPEAIQCSTSYPGAQRLCRCDDPADSASTFGVGYSNGFISTEERMIFQHFVNPGDVGVITQFWITYPAQVENGVIIRYYIDGEEEASIQFNPSLACGVGFYDNKGPWGTEWFGKGAKDAGWYNNFRIPFQKSLVVTVQHEYETYNGFYMILHGSTNIPIVIGGRTLPTNAKMNQVRINSTYQSLDWVPFANVTSGPGAYWMVTLAAESGNLAFLEGCVHAYFDGKNEFPGVVIATGTEDYFDSAWYFNGGEFYHPSAGFTHLSEGPGHVAFSAYKFHDKDPLFWKNGFQLIWRNGDMDDKTGMKCHVISKGKAHDNPTTSKVYAYSWYYTWPEN